jgi:uncharacterized membrane protein YhaH (DUF805 family)
MIADPNQIRNNLVEFKRRRRRQLFVYICLLVLFVAALWLHDLPGGARYTLGENIFIAVVAIILIGLTAFSLQNWRCPFCDRFLGRDFNPHFCPRCGARLK